MSTIWALKWKSAWKLQICIILNNKSRTLCEDFSMLHCYWWQICHKSIFVQWSVVSYCLLWHVVKTFTEFIVAFPLQQCLCKHAIMLHYVHIAYLVSSQLSSSEVFELRSAYISAMVWLWCDVICLSVTYAFDISAPYVSELPPSKERSVCLCSRLVQTIYHYIS